MSASERPLFERLVHDLKGPLSPLQTAAYLLRRTELPADKRIELAETVERQARRMAGMIEELGDWVRAREGRLVTRRRPVELAYVVDLALGGVPQLATQPQVDPAARHVQVDGDETRLGQAIGALLAFAAARDPAPTVRVWVDGGEATVDVMDAGADVGAPEALLSAPLPEPYDQGLGLRLIVADAIAQAHGGRLEANAAAPGVAMRLVLPVVA